MLNNKGHGGPIIPDWVCYVALAILIGIPTVIVNATVLGIQKLGYLSTYNPIILTAIGMILLFLFFYCIHLYDNYKRKKEWEKYKKEHGIK